MVARRSVDPPVAVVLFIGRSGQASLMTSDTPPPKNLIWFTVL